jgi:hypothetical protein
MTTIQELANRFYPEQDHSSVTYNKRLYEQVREIVEYHLEQFSKEFNLTTEWRDSITKNYIEKHLK